MNRNGRRWFIVAVAAVAILAGGWWWSRPVIGDPRFFGTWVSRTADGEYRTLYRRDGTGQVLRMQVDDTYRVNATFNWIVRDDKLTHEFTYEPVGLERLRLFVRELLHQYNPPSPNLGSCTCPFRFPEPDRLELDQSHGVTYFYTRISE